MKDYLVLAANDLPADTGWLFPEYDFETMGKELGKMPTTVNMTPEEIAVYRATTQMRRQQEQPESDRLADRIGQATHRPLSQMIIAVR